MAEQNRKNIWLNRVILCTGVAMVLYHLVNTQYFLLGGIEHKNVHLGFALIMVFLETAKSDSLATRIGAFICLGLSLVAVIYVGAYYEDLEMRAMFNTATDLLIGIVLMVIVIESTRRAFGIILPIVALLSIAYFYFGRYISGSFHVPEMAIGKIIATMSIGLTGLYGVALNVSASYVFLFVVFGIILKVSGAPGFFIEVGRLVGRKVRSGPAMSAVVTSALFGTTTGSIGANIVTTGSFTIPLMKNIGYKPEQAGAIEAAASNGGQIMPPVMGAAAFAMAAVTGIAYFDIAKVAIIPSLVYFATIGLYVQLRAVGQGISQHSEAVDYKEMLLRSPLFIVPLGIIFYLMALGKPLMQCAFWGMVASIVLSLFRRQTRQSIKVWAEGFTEGAIAGSQIAVACACLGLILETMTGTGIGMKLPGLVEAWSGGNMIVAALITAGVSIILGMGVSTIGVYLLVALVSAPILIKMGMGILEAHFFVFYFAVFAMVTPPVGVAAIIASKIAGAGYVRTANEAVKTCLAGFLLPFLMIWNPEILLQPSGLPVPVVILKLIASAVVIVALETSFVGYYLVNLSSWERILLLITGIGIISYFIQLNYIFLFIGLCCFIGVTLWQARKMSLRGVVS